MRLIDADALLTDRMKSKYYHLPNGDIAIPIIDIEHAPTAEPKVGKWIETYEGTMCSNCHKFPYDDGEYHIANWHSDFCPNCGAKMERSER